jgi:hypothetical protein
VPLLLFLLLQMLPWLLHYKLVLVLVLGRVQCMLPLQVKWLLLLLLLCSCHKLQLLQHGQRDTVQLHHPCREHLMVTPCHRTQQIHHLLKR